MKTRSAWRKWLLGVVTLLALAATALQLAKKFDTSLQQVAAQRVELAKRVRTRAPSDVDATSLLSDARTLSGPAMQGRQVGTTGGKLARGYLLQRFRDVGLQPIGASFEQPFTFKPGRGIRFWRAKFWEAAKPVSGVNLVGRIQGSAEPDAVILVTAHYDHLGIRRGKLYPGADDNASGVAAMLAVARYFRAHPPRHTVVFAAFDAEESGSRGSAAFVDQPSVPVASMLVDVNFDMVSRNDDGEIYVTGLYHYPHLRPIVDKVRATSVPTILYGHDRPGLYRGQEDWTDQSDQGSFHAKGIPFLYFGVADHDDYHRPSDTFEHIQPAFFTAVTDAAIDVIAALDAADTAQLRRED